MPQTRQGEAPVSQGPRYGIVGGGRMARHMAHYFGLLGVPFERWERRRTSVPVESLLPSCHTVLLLLPDDAIEGFVDSHETLRNKPLIHFSGSLVTHVAQGMHPLCSFSNELYSVDVYREIPFVCDPEPAAFGDVFPALDNPSYTIRPEDKALYHGVAVLAGSFTAVLWEKLFDTFQTMGLPPEAALPYLRQVHVNLLGASGDSQTGPLIRGDRSTIARNLAAFGEDPFSDVYRAVVRAVAPELLGKN